MTESGDARVRGTLVLVPTDLERRWLGSTGAAAELVGFGPVAAAARSASLIAARRPARVLLVGIAGTYRPEQFAIGSAVSFAAVAIDGIGVGEGETLRGPSEIGFAQWPGLDETLRLGRPVRTAAATADLLVTVCAAAGNDRQVAARRRRHPTAAAEEMEGYGVALACALAGVPLAIVRGISNRAGDRATANWAIGDALAAARGLAEAVLAAEWEATE